MPKQLIRYSHPAIMEHLASHYVLGTLSTRVRKRMEQLIAEIPQLEASVNHWQQSFIGLDEQTVELAPKASTWHDISTKITRLEQAENIAQSQAQETLPKHSGVTLATLFSRINEWFTKPHHRLMHACSFAVICLLSFALLSVNKIPEQVDPLSYVAVLTGDNKQAQLVASTYGESKKLVVNIINTPEISQEEDLELWVVSKTDHQARSLGIIPRDTLLLEQQLSEAQWRLIKDSDSLILTVEDLGGSPIGEPSDSIVSQGLCVRLKEWNQNV